jgi:hypothetical protein
MHERCGGGDGPDVARGGIDARGGVVWRHY